MDTVRRVISSCGYVTTKDPEFLRKFNRSTLEVIPWSFDGAIKHVLGDEYNIDELWHEYQVAVGDVQAQ